MRTPSAAALAAFRAARAYLADARVGEVRAVLLTVPAARAAIAECSPGPGALGAAPSPRVDFPDRPTVAARCADWREAWDVAGWPGSACTLAYATPPANDNPDRLSSELVLTIRRGPMRLRVRLPGLS